MSPAEAALSGRTRRRGRVARPTSRPARRSPLPAVRPDAASLRRRPAEAVGGRRIAAVDDDVYARLVSAAAACRRPCRRSRRRAGPTAAASAAASPPDRPRPQPAASANSGKKRRHRRDRRGTDSARARTKIVDSTRNAECSKPCGALSRRWARRVIVTTRWRSSFVGSGTRCGSTPARSISLMRPATTSS